MLVTARSFISGDRLFPQADLWSRTPLDRIPENVEDQDAMWRQGHRHGAD